MRRTTRTIFTATAIALIAFGTLGIGGASSELGNLEALSYLSPLSIPVNLSEKGTYSGRFVRTYNGEHENELRLVFAEPISAEQATAELDGLTGQVTLSDVSGRVLSEHRFKAADFRSRQGTSRSDASLKLALYEINRREGEFQLSIDVQNPAKGLAGRPHCLVFEYRFCGLEFLPLVVIKYPLYIAMLSSGTIILLVRRRKLEPAQEAAYQPKTENMHTTP